MAVAGNIVVRVGADISDLARNMDLATSTMRKAGTEVGLAMKNLKASTDLALSKLSQTGDVSATLKTKLSGLTQQLDLQSKYVERLAQEYEKVKEAKGVDAAETQRLAVRLQ